MQSYDRFIFDSYHFDASVRRISLAYSLDDEVRFEETIDLPAELPIDVADPAALDRALFALHLIGGISYFKTCLPNTIEIRSGSLDEEQARFWNTVYEKGLGEFFYHNTIDYRGLIDFPATSNALRAASDAPRFAARSPHISALVPLGGGKDSLVTVELLKQACIPTTILRVGQHPLIDAMAKEAGIPLLNVTRTLSPALFALNAAGAFNGHVPITAYLSFLSVALCEIGNFTHVVFSNEESAEYGNVEYLGSEINHQWSKSNEFETMFRAYARTYVTQRSDVFSLLRPLSELRIAEMFFGSGKYRERFTSCNRNWTLTKERPRDRWCGQCPKCAFAFVLAAAFLPREEVLSIFHADLFSIPSLLPLYRELLGIERFKPFECVGTPDETKAAFLLAKKHDHFRDTPAMRMFDADVLPSIGDPDSLIDRMMQPGDSAMIPEPFRSLLSSR